jgi:hypothetical protein
MSKRKISHVNSCSEEENAVTGHPVYMRISVLVSSHGVKN